MNKLLNDKIDTFYLFHEIVTFYIWRTKIEFRSNFRDKSAFQPKHIKIDMIHGKHQLTYIPNMQNLLVIKTSQHM